MEILFSFSVFFFFISFLPFPSYVVFDWFVTWFLTCCYSNNISYFKQSSGIWIWEPPERFLWLSYSCTTSILWNNRFVSRSTTQENMLQTIFTVTHESFHCITVLVTRGDQRENDVISKQFFIALMIITHQNQHCSRQYQHI